jgi:arylsulfatase A-like enzyme
MTIPQRLRERWSEALVCSAPVLAALLYIRHSYLNSSGMEIIERSISNGTLTWAQYAQFYAADVLETLIFLPLLLVILGALVSRRVRPWSFVAVGGLYLLLSVGVWITYHTLGVFPTLSLARDFMLTMRRDRDTVSPESVLSVRMLVKTGILLSVALFPLAVVYWGRVRAISHRSVLVSTAALLLQVAAIAFSLSTPTRSRYHLGTVERLAIEIARNQDDGPLRRTNWQRSEIKSLFGALELPNGATQDRTPAALASPITLPRGMPARPNVIFVILETASDRDYSFTEANSPMVKTHQLLRRSLYGTHHYSTYPYSMRANFSLISSIYDLPTRDMMVDLLRQKPHRHLDALPWLLRDRGYYTGYYFPTPLSLGEREAWMIRDLGFEHIVEGPALTPTEGPAEVAKPQAERAMFHRMIEDVARFTRDSIPFLIYAASSVGHAPYPNLGNVSNSDPLVDRRERVRAIAKFLDSQIGTLVSALDSLKVLENTILVVTGDHGVRNKTEDPTLDMRFSNEESFRVPFLMHYPAAFHDSLPVNCITSHIDVVPTILSLMQIDERPYLHQGAPMPGVCALDRVLFFMGGHYMGTDALHYKNQFFMRNNISESSFLSDEFRFSAKQYVDPSAQTDVASSARFFTAKLAELVQVQKALVAYLRSDAAATASGER